jgi:NADPH:quinone reductase-like Zn-dependent oxidoreductase
VIDYCELNFTESGKKWDRILDMVATRGPGEIAKVLADGGVYKAVGGGVPVLLSLMAGGSFWSRRCSIGILMVPSGKALTEQVARLALNGQITPHMEAVLPLSSVPEALSRTGRGEVLGKIVIRL